MPKKADPQVVTQIITTIRDVAQEIGFAENKRGEQSRLAMALDKLGVKTPNDGQWHYGAAGPVGLTRFVKKYMAGRWPSAGEREPESEHEPEETGREVSPEISREVSREMSREMSDRPSLSPQTDIHEETESTQEHTGVTLQEELLESVSSASETRPHPVTQLDPDMLDDLAEMVEWWRAQREHLQAPQVVHEERPVFDRKKTVTKTIRLGETMESDATIYALKHRALTGGTFSGLVEWLIWQVLGKGEKYTKGEKGLRTRKSSEAEKKKTN